jgi:hypothetical protein
MIEPCERPIMSELTQAAELAHWHGAADGSARQSAVRQRISRCRECRR